MTLDDLRDLLPAAKEFHFLNYAATAPLLKPSADHMISIIKQAMEPMPLHFEAWLSLVESARRSVADAIGASVEEITFTPNTSTALSLIAASIRWQPGDRILYPADEFPSNRYVWDNLAKLGVRPEAIGSSPETNFADQLRQMDLTRVRLVSFSAVSYLDGRRWAVAEIVQLCRAHGIFVCVDGIQAVGAVAVNVHDWDCDFLACGGQKWLLGPVGSGFLYIKSNCLKELHVPLVGWASSRNAGVFDEPYLEFVDGARRFEPGLPDIAAIAGLAKSVETLASVGWLNIFNRVASLNQRFRTQLKALDYTFPYEGTAQTRSGIVTVILASDQEAESIHQACELQRIILTQSRRHSRRQLRIAVHAPTTDEDVEILLEILRRCRNKGKYPAKTFPFSLTFPTKAKAESCQGMPKMKTPWRRALVTGASRGLGEAIAKALAKRGCDLTLIGRDQSQLVAVAQQLQGEYHISVGIEILDLSHGTEVQRWLNENQTRLDYDVLVNNAAMAEADLFLEADISRIRKTFETNFFTPFLFTQKILPAMLERGSGAILNIVTSGARCALPLFSGYASSKGALWAWSEALGRELTGQGITVTTFLPPHMESVTARRLGRKALAYYSLEPLAVKVTSVNLVAQQAVEALAQGRLMVAPWNTRIKLAVNAMAGGLITRQILKSFGGNNP